MPANLLQDVRVGSYPDNTLLQSGISEKTTAKNYDQLSQPSFRQLLKDSGKDPASSANNSAAPKEPARQAPAQPDKAASSAEASSKTNAEEKAKRKPLAKTNGGADRSSTADAATDNPNANLIPVDVQAPMQQTLNTPLSLWLGLNLTGQPNNNAGSATDAVRQGDSATQTASSNGGTPLADAGQLPVSIATPSPLVASATDLSTAGRAVQSSTVNAGGSSPAKNSPASPATNNPLFPFALPVTPDVPLANGGVSAQSQTSLQQGGVTGISQKSDPIVLTQATQTESQAPLLSPKTLAFAMRLGNAVSAPAMAQNSSADPSSTTAASLSALAQGLAAEPNAAGQKGGGQTGAGGSHTGADTANPFAVYAPAPTNTAAETSAVASANATATQPSDLEGAQAGQATSDPVRNMVLQLRGDDNRRIDVRLMNSGGELHVSVRSADTELASRLQEHMPELTARLDSERISNEVFLPKIGEAAKPETNGSPDFSNSANSGQPGSNQNHSSQGQSQQRQGRPDWVDLLEQQIS